MRVLVTGHKGSIGTVVAGELARRGHEVAGFDLVCGDDLLDAAAVRRAADGCAAVVHLAALPHDTAGTPERIMAVNVLGTWHVLLAAEAARVRRVVHFSSGQVFGTAEGERLPDYFPVDDAHPLRAARPYGLSKRLGEDLCAAFTERSGVPTVVLRPGWVWDPGMYARIAAQWEAAPRSEWEPFWEFGQFVDVRDVAAAAALALEVPLSGHHRMLLCAADIAATAPSLEMTARHAASVPVRDRSAYEGEPWRSLLDCSVAARVLGWRPARTWAGRGQLLDSGGGPVPRRAWDSNPRGRSPNLAVFKTAAIGH